jgi:signal peptidase I
MNSVADTKRKPINNITCCTDDFARLGLDILSRGSQLRFQAGGSSMRPLIQDADIVLIEPVTGKKLKVGDVALCSILHRGAIAHRVVRKQNLPNGHLFLIQGDQATQPDGWVNDEQILGRLASIERNGAVLKMWHPAMRILSLFRVAQARWQLGRAPWTQKFLQWIKQRPFFCRYLS